MASPMFIVVGLLGAGTLMSVCDTRADEINAHPQALRPTVVALNSAGREYVPILDGPPRTYTMRSGLIDLAPGKSVGKHNTEHYEELVIVLEGQGEMLFADGSKLPVVANSAVYCPPDTEHDVVNTGTGALRYVYVVSKAK